MLKYLFSKFKINHKLLDVDNYIIVYDMFYISKSIIDKLFNDVDIIKLINEIGKYNMDSLRDGELIHAYERFFSLDTIFYGGKIYFI